MVSTSKVDMDAGGTRTDPTAAFIAMPCSTNVDESCAVVA
jgi:hypothetical protein